MYPTINLFLWNFDHNQYKFDNRWYNSYQHYISVSLMTWTDLEQRTTSRQSRTSWGREWRRRASWKSTSPSRTSTSSCSTSEDSDQNGRNGFIVSRTSPPSSSALPCLSTIKCCMRMRPRWGKHKFIKIAISQQDLLFLFRTKELYSVITLPLRIYSKKLVPLKHNETR